MAYSEELNMFTVHHYSPIPILHVYTYMCIYPDCDKRVDSQFMASSVWSMSTRRLKIYSTATIVLVFVDEALLLCPERPQSQLIRRPAALPRLAKTHPKSRTLALQGQVPVEPAKLASLWSQ